MGLAHVEEGMTDALTAVFAEKHGFRAVEDIGQREPGAREGGAEFLGANRLTEPREVAVGSVLRIGQTVVELQR